MRVYSLKAKLQGVSMHVFEIFLGLHMQKEFHFEASWAITQLASNCHNVCIANHLLIRVGSLGAQFQGAFINVFEIFVDLHMQK